MKKIIKYVVSFSFVFLLFPVSVIAGEVIEAECTKSSGSEIVLFLLDSDGGIQNIAGEEADVIFTKDKAKLTDNRGNTLVFDFENGSFYLNGEKKADCKFSNLEAIGMETPVYAAGDKEVEVTELQEFKTYETICSIDITYKHVAIIPSRIIGSVSLDDFGGDGDIGVEALVDGNGNQARFSSNIDYEKVGNRLEFWGDKITTNATPEQFQEHFGLFPSVTCTAG